MEQDKPSASSRPETADAESECDRKLANYRSLVDAGTDPTIAKPPISP